MGTFILWLRALQALEAPPPGEDACDCVKGESLACPSWLGHALRLLWEDLGRGVLNQNLEFAAVFRQRAEELRLIARNTQDVDARQTLWDIAKDYERMAREREDKVDEGS